MYRKLININDWPSVGFCIIWAFFTIAFFFLSCEAYKAMHTTLFRYSEPFPAGGPTIIFGNVDITRTINEITITMNGNVSLLEDSIQQNAKTSFWINMTSCVMALFGFFAQIAVYRQQHRPRGNKRKN